MPTNTDGPEPKAHNTDGGTEPNADQRSSGSPHSGYGRNWRWVMLVTSFIAALSLNGLLRPDSAPQISYSKFYQLVEQGQVEEVTFVGHSVSGKLQSAQDLAGKSSATFRSRMPQPEDRGLLPLLRQQQVVLKVVDDKPSAWWSTLGALLPWLLIIGAWVWMSRRASGALGSGQGLLDKLVPKRDHRIEAQNVTVRFSDVAGLENAKRDLGETVAFLREPKHYARLGGKLPRGVLLTGAPGTGKTLLARAVAGEAGVPFYSITASEFIEMFVGVGASRVRELFKQAKDSAPSIVFIDEIDAVGRARGAGLGGGNDEREQTLNQLLAEMDGFDRNDRIVVMAATNRPDVLDAALLRPGRFDRHVVVDLPAVHAREAILALHTADKPLADDVSLADLATATPGFSGASLANLANEAALGAMRRDGQRVSAADFAAALDKVLLGDKREMRLSPLEKQRVAVHEAGHALVASFTEGAAPLRRVSIIPRGRALGVTQQQPHERQLATRSELRAQLAVMMGGYAAEQHELGEMSSGSENDLKEANRLATKMVAQFGMSESLGPIHHDRAPEHPFLGARIASDNDASSQLIHNIEGAAHDLVREALQRATAVLGEREGPFHRLVKALLAQETLNRADIQQALYNAASSGETTPACDEGAALAISGAAE